MAGTCYRTCVKGKSMTSAPVARERVTRLDAGHIAVAVPIARTANLATTKPSLA
jgi:hypothetical protein